MPRFVYPCCKHEEYVSAIEAAALPKCPSCGADWREKYEDDEGGD